MNKMQPYQKSKELLANEEKARTRDAYQEGLRDQWIARQPRMTSDEKVKARAAMLLDAMTMGNADEILGGAESALGRGTYREGRDESQRLRRMARGQDPTGRALAAYGGGGLALASPGRVAVPLMGLKTVTSDTPDGSTMMGLNTVVGGITAGMKHVPPSAGGLGARVLGGVNKMGAMAASSEDEDNNEYHDLTAWKKAHTHGRPLAKESDRAQIRTEILKAMKR